MQTYLLIIRGAIKLLRRNPTLWIFALMTGCGSTNAGISGAAWISSKNWYRLLEWLTFSFDSPLDELFGETATTIEALLLTVVPLIMICAIPLGILGRIGIIWGINTSSRSRQKPSSAQIYHNSKPFFGRVLLISIPVWLSFGMGFGYFSTMLMAPYFVVCMLPWIGMLLLLLWFVKVIFEISTVALVSEDLEIMTALKHGWQTAKTDIRGVIWMGFMLALVEGIGNLLIGLPLALLISPTVSTQMPLLWLGVSLSAYLLTALLLGSLLRASLYASWARFYQYLST